VREAALAYAGAGWPVLPAAGLAGGRCSCGRDCDRVAKHPLTRHGVHDATTEAGAIEAWWSRWPGANVAVATGPAGLAVIDVDPRHGGWDSYGQLADAGYRFALTATVISGGGGVHLYFASDGRLLTNTAGSLPGVTLPLPGIDLRARGGYVIAPPSRHRSTKRYHWLAADPVAPAPSWLVAADRAALAPIPPHHGLAPSQQGSTALEAEARRVAVADVGIRNHTLNVAAFTLGRLVAAGHLDGDAVRVALAAAARRAGLPDEETRRTIASGLRAGLGGSAR
jgi:hypothetical protein